ncbi:hypothetical protein SORDD24_00863 [Streptococcus oralis]|uniref:Uncharacterized protein n=1 Tax=Streptococcus oralis TaxID=1303 RepID=A0A139QRK8_STROR|nr:hypothetical protein SORDD24_00863 [Streptococcus oralis]
MSFLFFVKKAVKASVKELKDQNKNKNILTMKEKLCYNNRRYFLLLVSQKCTGTC